MDFNYNFSDAQSLLGSLDTSDNDGFQLTSNNLYQNEGFWSNNNNDNINNNGNYELNNVHIKKEYISPESFNNHSHISSLSPNNEDDQILNEMINFDDSPMEFKFEDSGTDVDRQLDELIQSSTQVPTPISSSASVTESPSSYSQKPDFIQPNNLQPSSTITKFASSNNSKVSKPKKSRSSHNLIEKKYRTNINSKIMELRDAVPALRIASDANQATTIDDLEGLTPAAKLNKASILTKATEYIKHLENKNELLSNDVFQLRNVLSQFQQMLPQIPHHQQQQQQQSQIPSQQIPQQQPQQQQQQQYQITPVHSPPQLSQQQQQPQQVPPPQPIHSHSQQSFTDQVNMGLNGFVPTLSQVQAAQLQLQNMQQNQAAPRSQHQQSQSDGAMSFGNKVLVGGMTALLGSQMFVGGGDGSGSDGFDYKGLSFIPIHKLLPIFKSDAGQFVIQFMKLMMVLFGAYSILEPILFMILSRINGDEKDKKPVYQQESSFSILRSYLEVFSIKLGFKDYIDELDKISQFNVSASKTLTKCLSEKVKTYNGWKKVLILFAQIENFAILDSIVEKDKLKRNEIASTLIEFSFTKLIFARLLSIKLGSFLSSLIGLNKTVDMTMLKIIKLMRFLDLESISNQNALQIYKLVETETDFIDCDALYDDICDLFALGKENIVKKLLSFSNEQADRSISSNAVVSNCLELIDCSEDLSIVNLIITIRCQEILDRNLIQYTKLIAREEDSDGSSNSSVGEDETDTELETKEEVVSSIHKEICQFEKLIPQNSFRLTKLFKFFKLITKPNLKELNEIVDIVKNEACDFIDFNNNASLEEDEDDKIATSQTKDSQINKIINFATRNSEFSKQHLNDLTLISDENYLLLTCSFILYYNSVGKHEECIQLNRFLKINNDLSLLSFIALFETSNILIDGLLKKEEAVFKSMAEITESTVEESEGSDDDGLSSSSTTINLNSTKVLESRFRQVEYNKSNIEQLILKSRLLISQSNCNFNTSNQLHKLNLGLKSEVIDKLVKMGKKINGYD